MKPDNKKRRSKKRRPDGYYGEWERDQIVKAKELKTNIKKVRKWIDRYMKTHPQYRHLKTVILLGIMMKRYGFSFRRVVAELHYRGGSRKAAGLKHVPSKSWLHKWLKRLPTDMLDGLVLFTTGRAAYGSFSADSTHHRFNRYVLIDDPHKEKRANMKDRGRKAGKDDAQGKKWVADTCKHHALVSPDGMVLASMVTDRDTADATMFEKLCAKIPEGSGPALGDSAYCSSTNCEAAIAKGREQNRSHTLSPRRTQPRLDDCRHGGTEYVPGSKASGFTAPRSPPGGHMPALRSGFGRRASQVVPEGPYRL